jgi:predicted aldo/keto reductase-like oxidoreductase
VKYRKFGNQDLKVSALGFGAMRLPTHGKPGEIDEPEATSMIRYAIDHGVNYVDTAYPYHDGQGEAAVGRALQDGYREKVKLVTKMPCWLIQMPADFDKYLDEQLARLQTDHLDFYLLHALFTERWPRMRDMGVLAWGERAIADGRIGGLGFSFHSTLSLFKEIVDAYDNWALCQVQYNFVNEDVQAGTEGLEYAAVKGLPVVIMEPLLGGLLADPPAEVLRIWDEAGKNPVDMALQWLWNKPEVSIVLSGMSTMEQVQQNIASAEASGVGTLTPADLALIARVRDRYQEFQAIPCTKCNYCMPCPNGLDIPHNFELYNQAVIHKNEELGKSLYNWHMREEERAGSCIACGECEEQCPQHIEISQWMPRVHETLVFKEGEP